MQNILNLINKEIIVFRDVSKDFEQGEDVALHNINLTINEGEFICLIGPSGCGKSTLLKVIAGLENESAGIVARPSNVSMVFQSGALFPWFTVIENVALGLRMKGLSKKKIEEESVRYVEMMGLGDHMTKYPRQLSGGQKQRVGIARALAVDPSVLLLDEPFAALDPKTTYELHEDLMKIWGETKKTIVMVSHLIEEAVALAERVILMKDFTIQKIYPISIVRPRHEQTHEFGEVVLQIRKDFFR